MCGQVFISGAQESHIWKEEATGILHVNKLGNIIWIHQSIVASGSIASINHYLAT